jgi:hypothetical protein
MTVYDVLYKRGEHQGRGIWIKCGVVLQKPDGKMSLKLDAVPVGSEFDGWLVISERRQEHNNGNQPDYLAGDVPF